MVRWNKNGDRPRVRAAALRPIIRQAGPERRRIGLMIATFPQTAPRALPCGPFPTTPPQNLKDFQPISPEHDRFRKIYAARGRRPDLQLAETLKGISWTQKIGVSSFADIEDRIVPNPKHFLVKDILNRTYDTRRLIH